MTFELTPEQEEARASARAFAEQKLAASAATIDEQGEIGGELLRELQATVARSGADSTALVVAVEELAIVSAAAAAASALGHAAQKTPASDASGLRGLPRLSTADTQGRLVFAAVACGVARAAVKAALDALRDAAPGEHDHEKPHWVIADAATEVEAARILTLQAAQEVVGQSSAEGMVAMAKLAATRAAQQAVEAAVRVVGGQSLMRGTLLERLSRDVRALAVTMGSEEELRATAAQSLLQR